MRKRECSCEGTGNIYIKIDGMEYVDQCYCVFLERKRSDIGELFQNKNLLNYKCETNKQKENMKKIKLYINKSLYVYGEVAKGKTHLLAGIYEELWLKEKRVYFYTESQLIDRIRSEKIKDKELFYIFDTEWDTFIIDDFGKKVMADWQISNLFDFIDELYKREKQVVISSNYTIETLEEKYGIAIARRIDQKCEHLEV